MKLWNTHHKSGFTLIELLVVIAILAALAGIGIPAVMSQMGAGDEARCRANLEQLVQLGTKYSQDMTHRGLLPTSGMDDDEDTENINESDGWWLSIAPEMDSVVFPSTPTGKMKVSSIFHCPADTRANVNKDGVFPADTRTVSYVSWTDGTEDRDNRNSCIRTTAKQNLDMLPWLSDGNPVKGKSVTDLESFTKMVMSARDRHNGKIIVAYASGVIKTIEIEEEETAEKVFMRMSPLLAKRKVQPADDEEEEEEDEEEEE